MADAEDLIVIFIFMVLLRTTAAQSQDSNLIETPGFLDDEEDDNNVNSDFLVPSKMDEYVEKFVRGSREYLFINQKLPYVIAELLCRKRYSGHLAFVTDDNIGQFLAEALSETNLMVDSLWTGGRQKINESKWQWVRENRSRDISDEIVKTFVMTPNVNAHDRLCLSFSRQNHDIPQFRPLACGVFRSSICERPSGITEGNGTTHPGWIKIEDRLYKIFEERLSWEAAAIKCVQHDHQASLAVLLNYQQCQQLGRYLLIGRSSLENAWIGAKFLNQSYRFPQESIILDSVSDDMSYPPWRNGAMRKKYGCILLDRHLANMTLYVEARCDRLRPYLCYKMDLSGKHKITWTDIIIGNHGYRLHYDKKKWVDARDYCIKKYHLYNAKLVEVTEKVMLHHLLYAMGENKTAVQHIWLGGRRNEESGKWLWDSNKAEISTGANSILQWITNTTFTAEVEEANTCLNMDRENHIKALNYGTTCMAQQNFVCYFTKENLEKLQEAERKYKNLLSHRRSY